MQLGLPTLVELSSMQDSLGAHVRLCKRLGLSFIELNMNLPEYQVSELISEELKQIMATEGIYFTIHFDEALNVSDFNEHVAKAYVDTVMATISLAKECGIPVLNMHMAEGIYFTLPNRRLYLFEQYKERYMQSLVRFRNLCETAIEGADIKICIENCGGFSPHILDGVNTLLESNVFALTLDIGHAHTAGYADEDFIHRNINRLAHMHVHDARGSKNHLALGDGEVNLHGRLALAEECACRCVIEVKEVASLVSSIEWLKGRSM